jgi:hypothetical protein
MDRQPLTDRLGDRLLAEYGGAAAAYSLRALNGNGDSVVRVRRASDNDEEDFTAEQIELGEMVNWVNSQIVPPLDIGVETSEGRIPVPEGGTSIGTPAAAYSLRNLSTTYTGNVVDVRRSSDDAVESFTAEEVSDGTLEAWVNTEYTFYTSDFSADLDGWGASSCILTPNIDQNADGSGQPPSDNWLRISAGDRLSIANNRTSVENIIKALGGGTYEVEVDYYAPETVGNHKIIAFTDEGTPSSASVTFDQGSGSRTYSLDLSEAAATSLNSFRIGSTNTYPTGTLLYLKNIRIRKVDANGFVSKWYDQSGNDNHATDETPASQPKIVDGGTLVTKLGQPSIDFTTGSTVLLSDSFSITETESAVFAIWQPAQDSATTVQSRNRTLFGNVSSQIYIGTPNADSQMSFKRFDAVKSFTLGLASLNTPNLHAFVGTTAGANYYFNGSSIYSDTATGTNSIRNNLRIGAKQNLDIHDTEGYISELIIYDSDQSANRTAIEANIGETYGITGIPAYDNTVDGFVETWYDQSGNGNDATQSVAASQPKIVDAGVLVTGGIDFDGVDDGLAVSGQVLTSSSFYAASVIQHATGVSTALGQNVFGQYQATTSGRFQLSATNSSQYSFFANATDNISGLGAGAIGTSQTLISVNGDGSNAEIWRDGTSQATDTYSGFTPATVNFTIGVDSDGSREFNGKIAEVIAYDSDQSANRVAIETNINDHYNIY